MAVPLDESQTCWTLIHSAASGSHESLDLFIRRYECTVRQTLAARWSRSWRTVLIDDAVQEVFLECIKPSGVLSKADNSYAGGFRALLYGVTRNIIRRFEAQPAPANVAIPDEIASESAVSRAFDRQWAQAIMKEASQTQIRQAELRGAAAVRRVDLLKARFQDGKPIREIAESWEVDVDWLHRQYAKARQEFTAALLSVVSTYQPRASDAENIQTCRELLTILRE